MAGAIRREQQGAIGRITIDRPEVLNAIDATSRRELVAAIADFAADDSVRVIVLTGAGARAFSAGADLRETRDLDAAGAERLLREDHAMLEAVRLSAKPVVARVNGYALGSGLLIALVADIAIAREDAELGLPEINFGAAAGLQASYLAGAIGLAQARALALLGERIPGREAAAIGLVHRAVPDGDLDAAVDAVAGKLAALDPSAVAVQRALARDWGELDPRAAAEASIPRVAALLGARGRPKSDTSSEGKP